MVAPPDGLPCPAACARLGRKLTLGRDGVVMLPERAGPETDPRLVARLAPALPSLAERAAALVLSGGATARCVLDGLGIGELRLMGEIEPGIPLALASHRNRILAVVLKAGGFGDANSLRRVQQHLRGIRT
jgi:uncharacterized protein YgbK (DUF1537 family)